MYQSILSKRQGTGSSGVGFAFKLVDVKDLNPAQNICLVSDVQSGESLQVGLNKRGTDSWPQTGDRWLIDRSTGVWMLQCKITDTSAPAITGSRNTISSSVQSVLTVLDGLGLIEDRTTAATVPIDVWQVPTLLNGFTGYISNSLDATVRYKRNYDSTVTVEGRATPPGSVANGVIMFNLLPGFRPPTTKYQTTGVANGAAATLTYGIDGGVALYDFGAAVPVRVLFHMRYSLV